MKYRNKITGAEIDTECVVSGGDWEAVSEAPTQDDTEKAKRTVKK